MTNAATPAAAILLIHCDDRKGLVATVTKFIHDNGGNVLDLEQHVDPQTETFFMRVRWDLSEFQIPTDKIGEFFHVLIGERYDMRWSLELEGKRQRMAIFVSKMAHCLHDMLARIQSREWQVDVPLIISNHPDLAPIAERFGIDYHVLPITKQTKAEQETRQLALLQEYEIDFIVLARYMQILSDGFVSHYPNRIINIHHSFLPAFAGARPYHSAYTRGVKIIGATCHYVTAELDAGPIIAQDVVHVSHRNDVRDLIRKGRDLEKIVLARGVWKHLQRKVLVYNNRTVVFE